MNGLTSDMRLVRSFLMSLALMIGLSVIGTASSWTEPTEIPKDLFAKAHSNLSTTANCLTSASHTVHKCVCSPGRPAAIGAGLFELRRPAETDDSAAIPMDTGKSLLSIARSLERIALDVPLNERTFLTGRELLARTARRLI